MEHFDDIPVQIAADLIKNGACYVVDVRTPEEFTAHRIAGAHLLPIQELQTRHPELPREPDKQILIYCEHGVRSLHACEVLAEHGWAKLVNMNGGMTAWLDAGLPHASGVDKDALFLGPPAATLKP